MVLKSSVFNRNWPLTFCHPVHWSVAACVLLAKDWSASVLSLLLLFFTAFFLKDFTPFPHRCRLIKSRSRLLVSDSHHKSVTNSAEHNHRKSNLNCIVCTSLCFSICSRSRGPLSSGAGNPGSFVSDFDCGEGAQQDLEWSFPLSLQGSLSHHLT